MSGHLKSSKKIINLPWCRHIYLLRIVTFIIGHNSFIFICTNGRHQALKFVGEGKGAVMHLLYDLGHLALFPKLYKNIQNWGA